MKKQVADRVQHDIIKNMYTQIFVHAQIKVQVRTITKFSGLKVFNVCQPLLKHNSSFSKSLSPCMVWPLPASAASAHPSFPVVCCPPATGIPSLCLGHTMSLLSSSLTLSPTPHITGSFTAFRPQFTGHLIRGLLGALSGAVSPVTPSSLCLFPSKHFSHFGVIMFV